MKRSLAFAFCVLSLGISCGPPPKEPATAPAKLEAYGRQLFRVTEKLESAARGLTKAETSKPAAGGARALKGAITDVRLAQKRLPADAPPELAACDRAAREIVQTLVEGTLPIAEAFDNSLRSVGEAKSQGEKSLGNLAGAEALYGAWTPLKGAIKETFCRYEGVYEECKAVVKGKASFPPFPRATWLRLGCRG